MTPADFPGYVQGPAGRLEALLDRPAGAPRAAVAFAHPHPVYGGTMHTKAVYRAAKALTRIGCAVLRFNFRGVGLSDGAFDAGTGEMDDYRAALDEMAARFPGLPLWSAGFSFGAWVALAVGAPDPRVTTLIAIAPPVDRYDFSAVEASDKPKFIIHGEMDELVPLKDVRRFYATLPEPKELIDMDGASHLLDGQTSDLGDVVADLLAGHVDAEPAG
jgi:alpha/beta superfamily hydrolase